VKIVPFAPPALLMVNVLQEKVFPLLVIDKLSTPLLMVMFGKDIPLEENVFPDADDPDTTIVPVPLRTVVDATLKTEPEVLVTFMTPVEPNSTIGLFP
jgi:hypothetical protein